MAIAGGLLDFFSVLHILIAVFISSPLTVSADAILGCGGFVEASSALIKSRSPSDPKLDYSYISVELCTVDGLVKDRTHCAPNGYYFVPVYDKIYKWSSGKLIAKCSI